MDESVEKVYKYSNIISICREEIEYLYARNEWKIKKNWADHMDVLKEIYYEWSKTDSENAEKYLTDLRKVRESIDDAPVCADIINYELIPKIYSFISLLDLPIICFGEYSIAKSKSGFYSLCYKGKPEYSMDNPLLEAKVCVDSYYIVTKQSCYIMGVELGYFAYSVYRKYYGSIDIYIFDVSDENIKSAYEYGVLDWIEPDKLHIVVDSDVSSLFSKFITYEEDSEDTLYYVSPHFLKLVDGDTASMIFGLNTNFDLLRNFRELYLINFLKNKKSAYKTFKEFNENIKRFEDFVVVGGGPSVNDYIDYLQSIKGRSCIIAVSTILKKLVRNGIVPDLAVIIDPTEGTYRHIDSLLDETKDIPLLYESQAYWRFIRDYKGEKIRILGSDSDHVKKEVETTGEDNWSTGPSVTCLAIEAAVKMGAKKIELIGCDLAYPQNKAYADSDKADAISTEDVLSVDGGMVPSSDTFISFRNAIEKQIERFYNVRFYNLSKHGAYIKGCYEGRWWEDNNHYSEYLSKMSQDTLLDLDEKYFLLWQVVYKYISRGDEDEDFWPLVSENFNIIRNEFEKNLIPPSEIITKSNFIVLLTSQFSLFDEGISQQILQDARVLTKDKGKNVLIVNTSEYMGGKSLSVIDCYRNQYNVELEDKEYVFYMGDRYAYYQLPENMPNIEYANSLIQYFSDKAPELVINYDELSLMAEAFRRIGNVEHR
ncbi:MAG: DUF115 domain-containing protein [Lachnospiraceae bacterium]|nr:DUF115 domain-containing protein [Lachnospiraceae bacterium]